ncbi:MAG: T9SS type A sorting domain-containing protein [Chitinophagales bacterium]
MRKKIFTLLSGSLMLLAGFSAQSQEINKGCFYIQASGYYRYFSIVQTYDGGYVIGGLETGFAGGVDQNFWVFKVDAAANILWSSSIGTTGNDGCFGIIETADHHIVAGGFAGSSGNQDFFILKYDENGNILWKKNVDHGVGSAVFNSVTEASDGSYILTGVSLYNILLYKIDAEGNKIWSTEINDGGPYAAVAQRVVPSTAGGYLISGWGITPGAFFTHVNEAGVIQWSVSYNAGVGYDAIPLSNGGYLIGGYESGTGQPHSNAFVTRIDSNGNKVWSKTYGGDGSETFYGLAPTSDGGFIGVGIADTGEFIPAGAHGFVAKCNSNGEIEWSKNIYSTALLQDVIQTADGGYALLGNGSVIKLDANGNACDECLLEDFGSWMEAGDVAPKVLLNYTANDSIFDSPYSEVSGGTKQELCIVTDIEETPKTASFSITPNPADQFAVCNWQSENKENIWLKIFDATGTSVYQSTLVHSQSEILNVENWKNGMYFCRLQAGSKIVALKFIVEH